MSADGTTAVGEGSAVLTHPEPVPDSPSRGGGHAWAAPHAHGEARRGQRSAEWSVWHHMIVRCTDPKKPIFAFYGARGITVSALWLGPGGFERFLEHVGRRPVGFQLDRIDNAGNYEPGNVRWVSRTDNMRNTRRARIVELHGESLPLKTWCERLGIPYKTVHQRIVVQGLDPVLALTRPIGRRR